MKHYMLVSGLLLLAIVNVACAAPTVSVKLRVVGEDTQPIPEADVGMSFLLTHGSNGFWGVTDESGYVETRSNEAYFGVRIGVTKEGYYKSRIRTGNRDQNLTMLLREKKNPIGMYAKKFSAVLPTTRDKVGFDFVSGDWVAPHGKGRRAHMYFQYKGKSTDYFNYRYNMVISFPNEGDGIQAVEHPQASVSDFLLPYTAPIKTNYADILDREIWGQRSVDSKNYSYHKPFNRSDNFGYFLRVGTELDEEKNLIKTNYVKIKRDINFVPHRPRGEDPKGPSDKLLVYFTYYFNPNPNDPNVEFGRNLQHEEQVREP